MARGGWPARRHTGVEEEEDAEEAGRQLLALLRARRALWSTS